jgi:hypothetical protein
MMEYWVISEQKICLLEIFDSNILVFQPSKG